ncbi:MULTISPECIES: hypothetical protein [Morganellaceae]|uniref:hypothetical protein n=1 Tax=Morganellaceae TaxID=1903414 RepID=UPI000640CA54|nr:hypothetical protein [Moellerella wisconsensis]KLN96205.1 hypothetical protein VK86_11570 [Moellerella wisconsensis]RFT09534.1 HK97 gp10 family phage protein [Providencia rettgeri]
MAKRLRGVSQVRNNVSRFIEQRKVLAARAVTLAVTVGEGYAVLYTPVGETSNLINNRTQRLIEKGTAVTGRLIYSAAYAAYVHEASGKLKGKPRAGENKGNYWDPNGRPKFLKIGFEEAKTEIDQTVKAVMKT